MRDRLDQKRDLQKKELHNKSKTKAYVVLSLIFIGVIGILLFGIFMYSLISTEIKDTENGGVTPPVTVDEPQEIDDDEKNDDPIVIEEEVNASDNIEPEKEYSFASIREDDTIAVYLREELEELIIELDQNNWDDLSISPDQNKLALIGVDQNGLRQLYIYDLIEQQTLQLTQFDDSGVNSYSWLNSENVLFNQGEGIQNWLYRYNFNANGYNAIDRINSNIQETSKDQTKIIYFNEDNEYSIYNVSGDLIWELSELFLEVESERNPLDTNQQEINALNILFDSDSNALVIEGIINDLENPQPNLYITKLNQNEVTKLNPEGDFKLVCAKSQNEFIVYEKNNDFDVIEFYELNTRRDNIRLLYTLSTEAFGEVELHEARCAPNPINNYLLIGLKDSNDRIFWYETNEEDVFTLVTELENNTSVVPLFNE